jgi:hypothetical protein
MIIQLTEEEYLEKRKELIEELLSALKTGRMPQNDFFRSLDDETKLAIMCLSDEVITYKYYRETTERLYVEIDLLKKRLSPLSQSLDGAEYPSELPKDVPQISYKKKRKWWKLWK